MAWPEDGTVLLLRFLAMRLKWRDSQNIGREREEDPEIARDRSWSFLSVIVKSKQSSLPFPQFHCCVLPALPHARALSTHRSSLPTFHLILI